MKKIKWLFLLFTILFTVSCEKRILSGDVLNNPNLKQDLYTKSKDTLNVNNLNVFISDVSLTRNFFPGSIPLRQKNKSNLSINVILSELDQKDISHDYLLQRMYVIKDNLIWKVNNNKSYENVSEETSFLKGGSTNGPQWDIDTLVDVVCEVQENASGKSYFLISKQNQIKKVS